ncbi:MAG: TolC family protein [Planctomycetota bacterium]
MLQCAPAVLASAILVAPHPASVQEDASPGSAAGRAEPVGQESSVLERDVVDRRPGLGSASAAEDELSTGLPRAISLTDALALALSNNLGLELAAIETEAARYDTLSSWGAFDWVFDAAGTLTDAQNETGSALGGGRVVTNRDTRLDLDLTRPLTTGGRFDFHFDTTFSETDNEFANAPELFQTGLRLTYVQPLLRGAWKEYATANMRDLEIAERRRFEERREARQFLIHDVEVAYWELVAAVEQLEVDEAALELGREQVGREEARLRAGDGTEVDVLQAQTEVATRTETLLQSENDVAQRSDDLKQLIVRDKTSDLWARRLRTTTPLPIADLDELQVPDWNDAYQIALGRRADLRTSRLDVDAARVRLMRARSERLYGLDLQLQVGSGSFDEEFSEAFSRTTELRFPTYSALLSYNMPLQNTTASNAERAARERLRGSQVTLEQSEVTALGDIRRAIREVSFRAQAVRAAEQSFVLARRQLEAEQQRFEADLTTTFEVLQFQQTLIASASSRTRARVEYAKSLVGLQRAQGLIGEAPDPNRN